MRLLLSAFEVLSVGESIRIAGLRKLADSVRASDRKMFWMMISVQVLDGTYGQSAAGIQARLERFAGDGWTAVADAETGSTGCIEDSASWPLMRGLYRIVLDSDRYFAGLGVDAACPAVVVIFKMRDELDSCQVRVTLCPHSYSAYLGAMDIQSLNSG